MDLFRQPEQDPAHVPNLRDLFEKLSVMVQPATTTPRRHGMGSRSWSDLYVGKRRQIRGGPGIFPFSRVRKAILLGSSP